jgi:putative heme-binding domain-containing protein
VLALKNGKVITGLIETDDGDLLTVVDSQGKEMRIRRDEVEEEAATKLSPMPANVAEAISEADFYNLMAFLLAHGQPPTQAASDTTAQ